MGFERDTKRPTGRCQFGATGAYHSLTARCGERGESITLGGEPIYLCAEHRADAQLKAHAIRQLPTRSVTE